MFWSEVFDLLPRSEALQLFKFALGQRTNISAPFDAIEADCGLPAANANNEFNLRNRPTRQAHRIDSFQIIAAFYLLAHRLFPVSQPRGAESGEIADDISFAPMPRHNQFARLSAVFDFQVTLGGPGQRAIR